MGQATAPGSLIQAQGSAAQPCLRGLGSRNAFVGCGREGRSEAAHTGTDGGMSTKASDYSCVPLCADCHTQAQGAYHRAGKGAFERRHGLSFAGIVARLNREWQARCA